MSQTFDPSTEVYAKANAMFNADGFHGAVAVIEYPEDASATPNVSSNPDGSISGSSQPGIIKAVAPYLYSGLLYIVPTSDVKESDLEALSDFTYTNKHIALAVQFSNASDASNLDNHVKSFQTDKNKLHNVIGVVIPDEDKQPVAEGVAMAAYNLPQDFKKLGNGNEFKPTEVTASQMKAIDDAECATVIDQADDIMFSSGRAMGGRYIDQFVNAQFAIDNFAYVTQQFLDHNKCNNDDATRSQLRATLATEAGQLKAAGILVGNPVVTVPPRSAASGDDVEARILNGVNINADIYAPIEHVNGSIALTV